MCVCVLHVSVSVGAWARPAGRGSDDDAPRAGRSGGAGATRGVVWLRVGDRR